MPASGHDASDHDATDHGNLRGLVVAAIGIVYGDIGTSPLYTLKECFHGGHGLAPTPENVLGILSLVIWALLVVVTAKYVLFMMRADNNGEGGILALMSLAQRTGAAGSVVVVTAGLVGATLFFGDGVITPAISVLSAVEGLAVVAPEFQSFVLPTALVVLFGLFAVQRRGTAGVGAWFGPIMIFWFVVLAALGSWRLVEHPEALRALDPRYGIGFFARNGFAGFAALGAVVLAVTGGEALYADMGHFGKRPVRLAWLGFALPALALNYLGQSALLLANPEAVHNPFFLMAPSWLVPPLVLLATAATVIASQAVISGAFSVTQQAIQLGWCPRMEIRYTSEQQAGQIYLPEVNERLLFWVVVVVLVFQSSSSLASAYGIAVTGTMAATTVLAFIVARQLWGWSLLATSLLVGGFLAIDLAFLGANLLKVLQGGWLPLALAGLLWVLMTTWRRGRAILAEKLAEATIPMRSLLELLSHHEPPRVEGTAVYLTRHNELAPNALLHNLKHNKVLHERIVLLTVETVGVPRVDPAERVRAEQLRPDVIRLFIRYGFMERPDIPQALTEAGRLRLAFDPLATSFFLGRETLIPAINPPMSKWRERLFILMSRNAVSATDFFRIPPDRVVELGTQVPI